MLLNKDFLVIFAGKLLQVVIVIATLKVSTMLLSPKEMGSIYLFFAIQTFFVLTFLSPLGQYINRRTHQWYKNKSILNNLFIYLLYIFCISLLSILIGYLLYSYFGVGNNFSLSIFLLLLSSSILVITLNQTYIPMLNMLHFRVEFTLLTILTSLFILIFGYSFVAFFGSNAEFWLFGIVLSNMIFAIYGFLVLRNKTANQVYTFYSIFEKLKAYDYKLLLAIVIPIAFATLFMWLQNSGYRMIIEQKIGLEFLGYLGVGLALSSQIASIFESILAQYLIPIYYQRISSQSDIKDRTESFNWLLNIKLPMYFLLALYVTIFSPYIVDILVNEKYKDVYIFTIFGIWIEFFRMFTNVLYSIALSELKTKNIMIPYIVGSLLTIIFVYISSGIVNYKFYLPLGLVVGNSITMILMYIYMKQLLNFSINYKLLIISLLISSCYLSVFLFEFEKNIVNSIMVVGGSGIYFLGTIFFIYKRGLKYDYS